MFIREFLKATAKYVVTIFVLIRKYFWHLKGKNSYLSVLLYKDIKVKLLPYGQISQIIYSHQPLIRLNRGFEFETFKYANEYIKPGDTIFDIGANIGIHSILMSKLLNHKCTIYAFEPNPTTYDILVKNLALNNCHNVKAINIGLSDTQGEMYLEINKGDAYASLSKNINSNTVNVFVDTVDNFVSQNNITQINFTKIDVEGAELFCLKGMKESLQKFRPLIILESNDALCNKYGYTSFDVLSYLSHFKYVFFNYEWAQWVVRNV